MGKRFHITIFDNFHRGDLDACWSGGSFSTAKEAIAAVKVGVDQELKHMWPQVGLGGQRDRTIDGLVDYYHSFAEEPVAFDQNSKAIFDTGAYVKARAAEIVTGRRRILAETGSCAG
ncbi:MAG TPA: hypothetical protein VGG01_14105 [Xanthobacteraceae bacterium]|jgi:hypothetical protein